MIDRSSYAEAGRAQRYLCQRAAVAGLTSLERRVVLAVLAYTASWSKTEDTVALSRLAGYLGLSHSGDVGRALRGLADAGLIHYRPGRGSRLSTVRLPMPPDGWEDRTATPSEGLGVRVMPPDTSRVGGTRHVPGGGYATDREALREEDEQIDDEDAHRAPVLPLFDGRPGTEGVTRPHVRHEDTDQPPGA